MAEANEKIYTKEEISKIAPHYRGNPQNFDINKLSKKRAPRPKRRGPEGPEVTPPTALNRGIPTPQKNENMLSEAIFGQDVYVTEIHAEETFKTTYAKLIPISLEVYSQYLIDERQLDRILVKEKLMYYATALLRLKLLSVKDKQKFTSFSHAEKELLKSLTEFRNKVPQQIHEDLSQIGSYVDKMGKETYLEVPPLLVTVINCRGGYHAASNVEENFQMFEEIPSLGVSR